MGIGKKIFLMPCIFFAIFFTVNINAGQERDNAISEVHNGETVSVASAGDIEQRQGVNNPIKPEIAHKMKKLQIPFIANDEQADETVKFYANTFAGSVFVTKDGEIVYSLPGKDSGQDARDKMRDARSKNQDTGYKRQEERIPTLANSSFLDQIVYPNQQCYTADSTHDTRCMFNILHHASCFWPPMCACYLLTKHNTHTENESITKGLVLKEELIGAKISHIKGEVPSATKVSYFKGNDPLKWKNNISTYDFVDLGEVYEGIDLKLKAYGNNVEKLFTVKPGANPEQIKVRLSGIQPRESSKTEEIQPPESPFIKGDLTKSPSDSVVSAQSNEKGAVGTAVKSPLEKGARGLSHRGLSVNDHGELEVETELGPVKFTKPIAYQEIDGKRVYVDVEYGIQKPEDRSKNSETRGEKQEVVAEVHGGKGEEGNSKLETPNSKLETENSKLTYSFKVASYDKAKVLIIDPLLASTYLGGDQADVPNCITLDNDGNIYVAGWTGSHNLPTPSDAYDTSNNGGYGSCDSFLAKLSGDLTQLLAATYLGGNSNEFITSIVIDKEKNVFVSGYTGNGSPEFPTTEGAFDTSWNGGRYTLYNGFISKFNGDLTQLLASTYLGGSGYDGDFLRSMAIDQNGNIYVTGDTDSRQDFPISTSAYSNSYNGGSRDGFISKLNGDLSAVLASTFFGGSQQDDSNAIAIDSDGNVYITGFTSSSDLPTTDSAYDTTYNGYGYYSWMGDAFVSKLNGNLSELLASSLLGGTKSEYANSVAIDRSGNIYISGWTHSSDFPVATDAYDTHFDGNDGGYWEYPKGDVFVSKLSNDLKELFASTYLGGTSNEDGNAAVVDTIGNIYVAGKTDSTDFPTTSGAFQESYGGSDGFVAKINRNLTTLLASTYLGGNSQADWVGGVAVKSTGNIYVAGHTLSRNFPTTEGAYDTSFNGSIFIPYWGSFGDGFVSKFDSNLSSGIYSDSTPSPSPTPTPSPAALTLTSITPNKGGDTGAVSILMYGSGFNGSATVRLTRSDQPDIEADPVSVDEDGDMISATFDLEGKEQGLWDVVVTNPDNSSVTKEDVFTIEEGREAKIWVDIVGRRTIMAFRDQTYYIICGNEGNIDADFVPVSFSVPLESTVEIISTVEDLSEIVMSDGSGTLDLSDFGYYVETEDAKEYSFLIPKIPAGETAVIKFNMNYAPDSHAEHQFNIEAWANPPMVKSKKGKYDVLTDIWENCLFPGINSVSGLLINIVGSKLNIPLDCYIKLKDGFIGALNEYNSQVHSIPRRGSVVLIPVPYFFFKNLIMPTIECIATDYLIRPEYYAGLLSEGLITEGFFNLLKKGNLYLLAAQIAGEVWAKWPEIKSTYIGCLDAFNRASYVWAKKFYGTSVDPNEKTGSQGSGEEQYISGTPPLKYIIYCENMGTATAAAQEVTITDQLGTATVDLDTFSLGEITFGSSTVTPPSGLSEYSTEVDLRPDKNVVVRIEAGLDKDSGLVTWHFVAIDPDTYDFPDDLMLGVLAPNVTPPEGEGSVFFTVMPKAGLPTGTEIRNKASIVFDVNEPIETNEWLNTIDNDKPSSNVLPLAATQYTATFDVQWTGSDNGSGIKDYTLYVSTNGGAYTAWLSNETGNSTTVTGQPGSTYAFYTVARDETGNTEGAPTEPDATTHIDESVVVPTPTPTPAATSSPVIVPTPSPTPTYVGTPTPIPTPSPSPTPVPTEPPTVVELVSFSAESGDDGTVILRWQTATEVDNAGFNVYRSRFRNGTYTKVNNSMIPAKGSATYGASYRLVDEPDGSGTYYYKLEDVDDNGTKTMHGPVKVRVRNAEGEARRR